MSWRQKHFPFRDNVDLAKKIGVSSILQPGGSIKDQEIIDVANTHGILWSSAESGYLNTK